MTARRPATVHRIAEAPAYIRESSSRRRHAMDDAAFRSAVLEGRDATAVLNALLAAGGRLALPDHGENIRLQGRISVVQNGTLLEGSTSADGSSGGTRFLLDGPSAGIDFSDVHESGIVGAYIRGAVTAMPEKSFALRFRRGTGRGCYGCFADRVRIDRPWNGIDISESVNTYLRGKIEIREPLGTIGVRHIGTQTVNAHLVHIETLVCDAPYPAEATSRVWRGPWQAATAYAANEVVTQGECIYQCTTAGISGRHGPDGNKGTVLSRSISDGSVLWQFISMAGLTWIEMQSYAYSLNVRAGTAINGGYGFRALDAAGAGDSYPKWAYFENWDADHSAVHGMDLAAGEDHRASMCWVSSTLTGNGVRVGPGYRGEGGFFLGNIRGNAQSGVLLEAPWAVAHNDIVDNSQSANATYAGVAVAADVSDVQIIGNRFLPQTGFSGQMQRCPVEVSTGASDGYVITNNIARGHAHSNAVQDGGRGINKVVSGNLDR